MEIATATARAPNPIHARANQDGTLKKIAARVTRPIMDRSAVLAIPRIPIREPCVPGMVPVTVLARTVEMARAFVTKGGPTMRWMGRHVPRAPKGMDPPNNALILCARKGVPMAPVLRRTCVHAKKDGRATVAARPRVQTLHPKVNRNAVAMASARHPTSARATFITKVWRVKLAMRNVVPRSFAVTI
jgi:hypothetical protein